MAVYRFVIHGRLPGQNEFIQANRTNWYVGNKMKRDAQKLVAAEIAAQQRGLHIAESVIITYDFFEPNRRRDKDNVFAFASKVIQDALVDAGVIKNDGWRNILEWTVRWECDPDDPRIEVTITPFGEVK